MKILIVLAVLALFVPAPEDPPGMYGPPISDLEGDPSTVGWPNPGAVAVGFPPGAKIKYKFDGMDDPEIWTDADFDENGDLIAYPTTHRKMWRAADVGHPNPGTGATDGKEYWRRDNVDELWFFIFFDDNSFLLVKWLNPGAMVIKTGMWFPR